MSVVNEAPNFFTVSFGLKQHYSGHFADNVPNNAVYPYSKLPDFYFQLPVTPYCLFLKLQGMLAPQNRLQRQQEAECR